MVFNGRAISHKTYIDFANKYKIPLVNRIGKAKTFKQLAIEIYKYEMKHVYPKPGKYGLYVIR